MTVARRSFGLPAAMTRHAIVVALVVAAVIGYSQMPAVASGTPPWSSIAVALGVGALAAIVGRGPLGAVFVVAGFFLGLWLLLAMRAASAAAATTALREEGWLYAAMLAAAIVAYLVVVLIIGRLRSRG